MPGSTSLHFSDIFNSTKNANLQFTLLHPNPDIARRLDVQMVSPTQPGLD